MNEYFWEKLQCVWSLVRLIMSPALKHHCEVLITWDSDEAVYYAPQFMLSVMKVMTVPKIFSVEQSGKMIQLFCFLLEYKKARQEIKKKSSDTLKLQKKAKKGNYEFCS